MHKMMHTLSRHWPWALALVMSLSAGIAIFNAEPIDAPELDARLAKLQDARDQSARERQAELQAARATVGDRK